MTEKQVTNVVATKIAAGVPEISPTIILIIISVILNIIKLYIDCKKKPEEILDGIQKPRFFQYAILRRLITREANKHGLVGKTDEIYKAFKEHRSQISLDEVKGLCLENQ